MLTLTCDSMLPVDYERSSYAKYLIYHILSEGLHPPPRVFGHLLYIYPKPTILCVGASDSRHTTVLTFLFCM